MTSSHLKLKVKKVRRFISDDELLNDLKEASVILCSETVSLRMYDKTGRFNSSTLISRFGGWNNALRMAGLKVNRPWRCSKKELLENLLVIWQRLGRQPKLRDMKYAASKFSRRLYLKVFGSWCNALSELEEFSAAGRNAKKYSKEIKNSALTAKASRRSRRPCTRLRLAVLKRDRFRCVLCGCSPAGNKNIELEVDHILPWSKGGETTAENLQTLCSNCNSGKADEII